MTSTRFRQGLLAYLALLASGLVATLFPHDVPETLQLAYDALPLVVLFGSETLTMALLLALLGAALAAWIGLYRLRRWGRTLALCSTVAVVLLLPFLGASIMGGLASACWEASATLWGGLLACTYWSPVAGAFEAGAGREAGMAA